MTVLDIDPGELNDADPLLFREMQGLCTLCSRKAECMLDLSNMMPVFLGRCIVRTQQGSLAALLINSVRLPGALRGEPLPQHDQPPNRQHS